MDAGDEALEHLDHLAAVEHALCVEYLFLHCALGGGLDPIPDADQRVHAAGQELLNLAQNEMRHLRRVDEVLRLAGRSPSVRRAIRLDVGPHAGLALAPLTSAQLDGFADRERNVAGAVDDAYRAVAAALGSLSPDHAPEWLDQARFVVDGCSEHAAAFTPVTDGLAAVDAHEFPLVVRDEPADDVERALIEVSDRHYGIVVDTVAASFAHDERVGGQLLSVAVRSMDGLYEVLRLLMARGVLPRFRLPAAQAPPV